MKTSIVFFLITATLGFFSCMNDKGNLVLVENGESTSSIVVSPDISNLQLLAIEDFQNTIRKATGATIPVVKQTTLDKLPQDEVLIILGPSPLTEEMGISEEDLKPEEFQIRSVDNKIIIMAKDLPKFKSSVTIWAFSYILDHYVGVRWLWPGDLGTYIPEKKTIEIPPVDVKVQQALVSRVIRHMNEMESKLWLAHHQFAGKRIDIYFGHTFLKNQNNGDWWGRFHDTHPEYLAQNPEGKPEVRGKNNEYFKLCISNPEVADEIIRIWETAGMPDYWSVCPNDGAGFCTCENCMELDATYGNGPYEKEDVWMARENVSVTDRYVWFWNGLINRMREKNPNIRIGVYFYSKYRNPPVNLKLEKGIIGCIVHDFNFSHWEAWQNAGAEEIGLRPNWWHMGASAPHLPLHLVGDYLEQARLSGMFLIDMGTSAEFFGTQSPYYYLVARLIARPDLNTEEVISEYCEGFGEASEAIRKYIDFWEDYDNKVAFNIPAGGMVSRDPDGIYEKICIEKFGKVIHPLRGHWRTIPYIYTDEILKKGQMLLDEAAGIAEDEEVIKRIDFLRDGLMQLSKTSDFIAAQPENKEEALKELASFGKEMKVKYDFWGSDGIPIMKKFGVIGKEIDLNAL